MQTTEIPAPAGLRQRKQARTREALIAAGMQLFLEHGFDAVTVDQIAAAAEVSRRSFFRYFETKGDLVLGWTRELQDVLVAALQARPADEAPLRSVQAAFLVMVGRVDPQHGDTYGFARLIHCTPSLRGHSLQKHAEWEDALALALATRLQKTASGRLQARLTARVGVAAFRTAMDVWLERRGRSSLATLLDRSFAGLPAATDPLPARPGTQARGT